MFGYDNNGNIYFIKSNEFYRIDINKNDVIELIKLKNLSNILSEKIEYKKINKQNMLHIKSIENALCELEDITDDEDEKEKFSDIYEQSEDYKYNPEKRYFHSEENNYNYETDDIDENRKIILYENINDKISKINLDNDIPSFETLIINGNTKSNDLIFRTEIINDQPLYRITIFTNITENTALLVLNIIGTKFIKFNLNYTNLEITKEI